MARIRYNNAAGTLASPGLTSGATTINFTVAPPFATLTGGDYIALVLDPGSGSTPNANFEIVHLTAYTAAATSGTILRGQEGTSGVAHATGATWINAPVVQDLATTPNWADSNGTFDPTDSGCHADSNGDISANALDCDCSSGYVGAYSQQSHADSSGFITDGSVSVFASQDHANSGGTIGAVEATSQCFASSGGTAGTLSPATYPSASSQCSAMSQGGAEGTGCHADSGGGSTGTNCHADSTAGFFGSTANGCHANSASSIAAGCQTSFASSFGHVTNSATSAAAQAGGTAAANYASATGQSAKASQPGEVAEGATNTSTGLNQTSRLVLYATAATGAQTLTLDGTIEIVLGAEAVQFTVQIAGHDSADGAAACFQLRGAAFCDGTTARIVGTTIEESWLDSALSTATATVTASGAHLVVTCTPPSGKTVGWAATATLTRCGL